MYALGKVELDSSSKQVANNLLELTELFTVSRQGVIMHLFSIKGADFPGAFSTVEETRVCVQ